MKPTAAGRVAVWAGLAVLAIAAAYGLVAAQQRSREREEVAKMVQKMQTICAGRFLIDLPSDAAYYVNGAIVAGFRISWKDESREQFLARVATREAEINAEKNQLGHKSMESVVLVDGQGFTGKIFTFDRSSTYTMNGDARQVWEAIKLEGYVNSDGKSFNFIADGYDPAKANNLKQLIGQLRLVPSGTIPTAPGFCFGPGMLIEPVSAAMTEKIVLFASLPRHPDVAIAFNTMAGLKPTGPGLLARRARATAAQSLLVRARFSALRSGPRTVNGLAGEEAAMMVTEGNFSQVYGFDWEFQGTEDNVLTPAIHLEMSSGNNPKSGGEPIQSTLSQKALLELWDSIASRIRIRPTASHMGS